MKKFLVFMLVLLLSFCMFSCSGAPNGDDLPEQEIEQGLDDGKQSGGKDSEGNNSDNSQSSNESDDVEQSGGDNVQGTPVPPIHNGGDFDFN